jgi:hypothetical protein
MTLDEAIAKSHRFLTELWEERERDEIEHLREAGASDDEIEAVVASSRERLESELSRVEHHITAMWFTDDPQIH